jgi:hypothetical protein
MMDLPEPAIRWLVCHVSSNAELACLSNVSKKWREIVIKTILDQAKSSLEDGGNAKRSSLLLLPSMVRFLLCHQRSSDNKVESYCLSWFHPDGIEFKQLAIDPMDDSDDEDEIMYARDHRGDSPQPFAPSGEQSYAGSEEEGKASRRHGSRSPTPLLAAVGAGLRRLEAPGKHLNCMYQWNGYREANEVLRPFGYANDFVRVSTWTFCWNVPFLLCTPSSHQFLQRMINLARTSSNEMQLDEPSSTSEEDKQKISLFDEFDERRTFAVRGATFARPEGYCLCWDNDQAIIESHLQSVSNDHTSGLRQQDFKELMRRRSRRRRELQREVLPRVLYSAPNKGDDSQLGIRQPCVQFLNVDSSHAVRLFTPPFKPGPVPAPITIFCVAIATEDGCFLSGIRRRFELGHLYPESPPDNLIERSPICICTDVGRVLSSGEDGNESQEPIYKKQSSYNSDDSSCDTSLEAAHGDSGLKCVCPFAGLGNEVDEDDENQTGKIYRGRRGPGMWHCYTAVFDGASSSIRIDGVSEPLRCNSSSSSPVVACLDGLTIGADHTFDMSLCFGQGSDGEGEGAMGELAVFKGRLDIADIEVMERHLMTKHGIATPDQPESDLAVEDEYSRLAHAMLAHAPHHNVFASGLKRVPLRYMANHRIVAWRQTNPVTGEKIRVQRIGSKFGDSSSDF